MSSYTLLCLVEFFKKFTAFLKIYGPGSFGYWPYLLRPFSGPCRRVDTRSSSSYQVEGREVKEVSEEHLDAGLPPVEGERVDGGDGALVGVHVPVNRRLRSSGHQSEKRAGMFYVRSLERRHSGDKDQSFIRKCQVTFSIKTILVGSERCKMFPVYS